ncbi:MAG: ATP phosphoribosyltransferase [Opitutales bacterium]|nr:ATP phosphoribosyltransferase [Opitutales bacterium]MCH8541534.1 ATP phosphoribosyltransferase [Opitutales bacterium]
MIRIALPNKGALSEESVALLKKAGYRCRRSDKELICRDTENQVEFVFLRPRDIAIYVGDGLLELGVTGRDLAGDSQADVEELLSLGFGGSSFYYAAPKGKGITPEKLEGLRIATSYPNLVKDDLARRKADARVIRLDGAVEISVQLGVADVIADVVQSGRTLEQAGLETIGEPILKSEAILIGHHPKVRETKSVQILLDRLRGVVVARDYAMIEYDIPETLLTEAEALTPGIEAPTLSPLRREGWVAVKAMVGQKGINRLMDDLKTLGAKGIIVSEIQSCRL